MTTTLESLFQAATRPMQGPLTRAQEQELMTLKFVRWDGKALAEAFESKARYQRA